MATHYSARIEHERTVCVIQGRPTFAEAEADRIEYLARAIEQGLSPVTSSEIVPSCSVCKGVDEHRKVQTARPHNHRYCPERCWKTCPESKQPIALPAAATV